MASPRLDLERTGLNEAELRRSLAAEPQPLWTDLRVLPITGSTNLDVSAEAALGAKEGLVIVAEAQRAGRGRHDRQWVCPPMAGLTFSVLLRPTAPKHSWGWLPLIAGLALRNTVSERWSVPASLKWPNDLLLGEPPCKAAGILAAVVPGNSAAVVLGVGLNVTNDSSELPRSDTTSLWLMTGDIPDRGELLLAVLAELAVLYRRWQGVGGDVVRSGIRDEYLRSCDTLGRRVTATLPTGTATGKVIDIDPDGRLVVATASGPISLAAGDVANVRGAV